MLAKLIQLERMPSFFAVEELPLGHIRHEEAGVVDRRSWSKRLAIRGRAALENHRAAQRARSAAAW